MRILRGFWKLLVGIKDALVLLMMLLFFGLIYAALSAKPNPAVTTTGALLVDLNGAIVEQPSSIDPVASLTGSSSGTREFRLRDVVRALDAAASDDKAKAVVLDLDRFSGGGQSAITTVGEAIDKVRRAGKPVLAYATGYSDDSYQLAAHASEVWLDPMGAVLIAGPGGTQLYYKGLLDKLGVNARVYRVGQFKSAVEPFTRTDQSPEARAANQALVDALWQNWQGDIAKARPKAKVADYVGNADKMAEATGGDMAQIALQAGLVDKLGDRLAFGRRVAEIAGAASDGQPGGYQSISLDNWTAAHPEATSGDAIGVLTIAGEIVDGKAPAGTAGGDTVSKLLLDELARNRIKALVVRVDSPGGSVSASERIRGAILEAKRMKLPIVVSMGSVAASGGYWVSTPADRIFAEPSTITGSIGVFGIIPTFEKSLGKIGLSADGVKTTPLTGEPDVLRGTSAEFDRLVQLGVENTYRRFTGLVAQSRHLTPARVDEIGQGRVWAGGIAHQIGLVDQFGGLDEAVAAAAKLAKLDPAKVHPLFIEKQPGWLSQLLAEYTRKDDSSGDSDAQARDPYLRIGTRPDWILAGAIADAQRITTGATIQARCLSCPGARPPQPAKQAARALLGMVGLQ
ncbi:signal peptide peptidase SppA [Flavisphingomonas formosensis]|uniref:signal peptide peptidase SppA n=1 Tax=Flavisphingomonas formosensis TaxID=861534 RepID=UPI0012FA4E30|nr:signal peptide peptidase SppA [Sphingomonas formosensis]